MRLPVETSDMALLSAYVSDADREALRALIDRHYGRVLGLCRRHCRDEQDAQDACQLAFLALVQNAHAVHSNPLGWLRRSAINACKSIRRSERARRAREQAVAQPELPQPPDGPDASTRDEVWATLQSLPEQDHDLVRQLILDDVSQRTLAAEWGVSQQAVSKRLARSLGQLRVMLTRRGVAWVMALWAALAGSRAATARMICQWIRAITDSGIAKPATLAIATCATTAILQQDTAPPPATAPTPIVATPTPASTALAEPVMTVPTAHADGIAVVESAAGWAVPATTGQLHTAGYRTVAHQAQPAAVNPNVTQATHLVRRSTRSSDNDTTTHLDRATIVAAAATPRARPAHRHQPDSVTVTRPTADVVRSDRRPRPSIIEWPDQVPPIIALLPPPREPLLSPGPIRLVFARNRMPAFGRWRIDPAMVPPWWADSRLDITTLGEPILSGHAPLVLFGHADAPPVLRGLAFQSTPEPATAIVLLMGGSLLLHRRR